MGTILTREWSRLSNLSLTDWSREVAGRTQRFWLAALAEVSGSLERSRQRRSLSRLDRRMLQDLGLAPEQVYVETRKWFWEV